MLRPGPKPVHYGGPLGIARNSYDFHADRDLVTLYLQRGFTATIRPVSFPQVAPLRWHVRDTGGGSGDHLSVVAMFPRTGGGQPRKYVFLHRHVLGLTSGGREVVDHVDRNPLNNCPDNLRITTDSGNARNRGLAANNSSGFKGVYFYAGKWHAQIAINGKCVRLGRFTTKEEAARAYDAAAIRHYGLFAATNVDLGLLPPLLVLPVPEPMAAD